MAVNTTEKRLAKLEDELRSLKSTYSIAGSLAKMYYQQSSPFLVGGGESVHAARFKFTPKYGRNHANLTKLFAYVDGHYVGHTYIKFNPFFVEPQDGSGEVIIQVLELGPTDEVTIIAKGPSPGEFSRVS